MKSLSSRNSKDIEYSNESPSKKYFNLLNKLIVLTKIETTLLEKTIELQKKINDSQNIFNTLLLSEQTEPKQEQSLSYSSNLDKSDLFQRMRTSPFEDNNSENNSYCLSQSAKLKSNKSSNDIKQLCQYPNKKREITDKIGLISYKTNSSRSTPNNNIKQKETKGQLFYSSPQIQKIHSMNEKNNRQTNTPKKSDDRFNGSAVQILKCSIKNGQITRSSGKKAVQDDVRIIRDRSCFFANDLKKLLLNSSKQQLKKNSKLSNSCYLDSTDKQSSFSNNYHNPKRIKTEQSNNQQSDVQELNRDIKLEQEIKRNKICIDKKYDIIRVLSNSNMNSFVKRQSLKKQHNLGNNLSLQNNLGQLSDTGCLIKKSEIRKEASIQSSSPRQCNSPKVISQKKEKIFLNLQAILARQLNQLQTEPVQMAQQVLNISTKNILKQIFG